MTLRSDQTAHRAKHIVGLDAVRFLAAALVVGYHLAYCLWALGSEHHPDPGLGGFPLTYEWLARFAAPGWIGVQIFFVLSGLVIAYSAEGATRGSFFRGRVLRLAPAVWICASISAVTLFLYGGAHLSQGILLATSWLKSVIFYPSDGWIDGSYWTLGVEISFYALVLLVIACGALPRIKWVVGIIGLASASFWIVDLIASCLPGEYAAGLYSSIEEASHLRIVMLILLPHGCFFALGAFLKFVESEGISFTGAGCILIFLIGGILQIRSSTYEINWRPDVAVAPMVPIGIWLAFLAAIVASVRWNYVLAGGRLLFASTLRQIGLATYPLYLVHQQVGYVSIDLLHRYLGDMQALITTVAACVGLSLIVSLYLEPIVRGALKRTLGYIQGLIEQTFQIRTWPVLSLDPAHLRHREQKQISHGEASSPRL